MIPLRLMKQAVDFLGGTGTLGRPVTNFKDLESLARDGIPEFALNTFIERLSAVHVPDSPISSGDLFERQATVDSEIGVLTPNAGHALVRIVRLFVLLSDRFESEAQAARFLVAAHPALDETSTAIAALTESGSQAVDEIISRGEHGLPA